MKVQLESGQRLVIFDCDGVLIDSEALTARCLSAYLHRFGIDLSIEELRTRYRARALTYIVQDLKAKHDISDTFAAGYSEFLYENYRRYLKPIPGAIEAVMSMKNEKCVASNAPPEKLALVLKITGFESFFEPHQVFSAYEVGFFKPDPKLFLFAAQTLGYPPENCIVIEDSDIGVKAAQRAQMRCLQYKPEGGGISSVPTFQSMRELPKILKSDLF